MPGAEQLDVTAGRDAFEAGEIDLNRPRADDDHVDKVVTQRRFPDRAVERHQLPVQGLEQHAIGEPCLNILVSLISVLSPFTD